MAYDDFFDTVQTGQDPQDPEDYDEFFKTLGGPDPSGASSQNYDSFFEGVGEPRYNPDDDGLLGEVAEDVGMLAGNFAEPIARNVQGLAKLFEMGASPENPEWVQSDDPGLTGLGRFLASAGEHIPSPSEAVGSVGDFIRGVTPEPENLRESVAAGASSFGGEMVSLLAGGTASKAAAKAPAVANAARKVAGLPGVSRAVEAGGRLAARAPRAARFGREVAADVGFAGLYNAGNAAIPERTIAAQAQALRDAYGDDYDLVRAITAPYENVDPESYWQAFASEMGTDVLMSGGIQGLISGLSKASRASKDLIPPAARAPENVQPRITPEELESLRRQRFEETAQGELTPVREAATPDPEVEVMPRVRRGLVPDEGDRVFGPQKRGPEDAVDEQGVKDFFDEVGGPDEAVDEAPDEIPAWAQRNMNVADEGKVQETLFPGTNERIPTQYVLADAADIRASHTPNFQKRPPEEFPEEAQWRAYHGEAGKPAREHTQEIVTEFDEGRVLDPTESAAEGPPIVTRSGVAAAGNGRIIALQNLPGEKLGRYKATLRENAAQYGLDPAQVDAMERPMLVRRIEMDDIGRSAERLKQLNRSSDVPSQKEGGVLQDAAARADQFRQATGALKHFTETVEPDQTLNQYLGLKRGRDFLKKLREEGVISRRESAKFLTPDGTPTKEGKQTLERMFYAAAIGDPEVVARAPDGALRKLDTALPAIIRADQMDGWEIGSTIRDALDMLAAARANDLSVTQLAQQGTLGDDFAQSYDPRTVQMARFLDSANKNDSGDLTGVKNALRGYADDAEAEVLGRNQEDMFGHEPKTPDESFKERFKPWDKADEGESGGTQLYSTPFFDPERVYEALGGRKGVTPTAQGLFAAYANHRAQDADSEREALGWSILTGVGGTLALRGHAKYGALKDVPFDKAAAPARKAASKLTGSDPDLPVGDQIWDRMMRGKGAVAEKMWDLSPRAAHWFFPGETLPEKFKSLDEFRTRQQAEYRHIAQDLQSKIDKLGDTADEAMSKAIDLGEEGPDGRFIPASKDEVRKFLADEGVEDVDGAMEALEEGHRLMSELGQMLVDLKLMSEEAFNRNTGWYAPRLYKEVGEVVDRINSYAGRDRIQLRPDDLDRLKERDPENWEKLADQRVESAKTRFALGVVQEGRLAATEQFFKTVANSGEGWIHKPGYDARMELRDINRMRARWRRKKGEPTGLFGKRAEELKEQIEKFDAQAEKEGLVQIPDNKKYGSLAGTWAQPNIAYWIKSFADMPETNSSITDWYLKWLRRWKAGKTVLNPATHGRNIVSAQMLSWLGDGPAPFGSSYARGWKAIKDGKGNELYDLARENGLLDSTYYTDEIEGLGSSVDPSISRIAVRKLRENSESFDNAYQALDELTGSSRRRAKKFYDALATTYMNEDLAARLAHFDHKMDALGMSPKEAAEEAKKWVVTYDNLAPAVKAWSRTGQPFFAYTARSLPRVAESMIRHPIRYAAVGATAYATTQIWHDADVQQDVLPGRLAGPLDRMPVPDWMKKGARLAFPVAPASPIDGPEGTQSYLDFTYIAPWGDIAEGRATNTGGIFDNIPRALNPASNPIGRLIAETTSNKSFFTGEEILTPDMTPMEKGLTVADQVAKQALPSLTPGIGWGAENLAEAFRGVPDPGTGETRSIPQAIMGEIFGMKQRSINPQREYQRRIWEWEEKIDEAQKDIREISQNKALSPATKKRLIAGENEKIREFGRALSELASGGVYTNNNR